jgi:hypothetical protein
MASPMTAAQMRAAMKKWGVQYREYPNWSTRRRPGAFTDVHGVVIHHTGSDSQTDDYLKWIFTEGRASEGIPAPLCHVSTDMDGDVWIGSIGRANHAGKGSSRTLGHVTNEDYAGLKTELAPGPDDTDGNAHFYGNEVRYDGGQVMTPKQYASATRWAAAICDHYGWSALSVIGHREWSSRKNDPGKCLMNQFRTDVAALLKTGPGKVGAPPTDVTPKSPVPLEVKMTLAEFKAYMSALYGPDGTEGKRWAELRADVADIQARLQRIEDDTDGVPSPKA